MWWQVLVGGGVVEFSELTSKIISFGFNAYPYCNFSLTGQFFLESNHRYSFAISNVGESANLAWKHIKTDLEMKKKIIPK
jgi:hypothetical protein